MHPLWSLCRPLRWRLLYAEGNDYQKGLAQADMEKNNYRLKGHESFVLREGWLTKGLNVVYDDARVFSQNNGADALGVGTNMAKSIRYWLRAGGLIVESIRDGVQLSDLGYLLYRYDPYMEDINSLWIIHSNIARNFKQATSWNVFWNEIDVSSFRREELVSMMTEHLISVTGDTALPERSIRDDCSAILAMYTDGHNDSDDPEEKRRSPFSALGLLVEVMNTGIHYERRRPAYDQIDPSVILYMIADRLENNGMLSIDEIVGGVDMPGRILNLSRVAVNDYLDMLQRMDYIIVNRTAGLDVVYPNGAISAIGALQDYQERRRPV